MAAVRTMKRVLVTGGAGFIGSNFIRFLLQHRPELELLVNLDMLTYAGSLENLEDLAGDPRYRFVQGDIRDAQLLDRLFADYAPDTVVNFAAESHVDRSIADPAQFLSTNVLGTQCLLEAARRHWALMPQEPRSWAYWYGVRFLQISTDEVYGALGDTGKFRETAPLAPNNPYAASKASADMVVRAYAQTYGLPVIITRCSNNYGPRQHPEKLIPRLIWRAMNNNYLPLYGDGRQVRDWLYVPDHCAALLQVLEQGEEGRIYNISGDNEHTNQEVASLILKALGRPEGLIGYVPDRPGHDSRYGMDSTRIKKELGWRPAYSFEQGLEETVAWYLEHRDWLQRAAASGAW